MTHNSSIKNVYFHVDLDAFFASVEEISHPEYKGKPLIIGASPGKRGVVSTCSYAARKYGVRSAMPISEAYRLCPNGIYLPVNMKRYQEMSEIVINSFYDFTPDVEQISIDEAFLDMTGTERIWGTVNEAAEKIKKNVYDKTGLTISIGVAPNRYLAKIASGYKKPDGLTIITENSIIDFLDSLPITKLWGAGEKTQERFRDLHILTIPDLRKHREETLKNFFGKAMGSFLYSTVRGIDPGIYTSEIKNKSISSETTFEYDIKDPDALRSCIRELSFQVAYRLFKESLLTQTVCLKIRYADFTCIQAQQTIGHKVFSSDELYDIAVKLFEKKVDTSKAIRLIGIQAGNAYEKKAAYEEDLFEDRYSKSSKIETIVFGLKSKGKGTVIKASSLKVKNDELDK